MEKTIFDVLGIDFSSYPDDSFIIDIMRSDQLKSFHKKTDFKNKLLGLFSELTVLHYKNFINKNFTLKCDNHEFDKYMLPDIVDKIFALYGKDDRELGSFTRDDFEQINDGFWIGRNWSISKFHIPCAINYNEEDGCTLFIWS